MIVSMLQSSKPFIFILGSVLATEILMPFGSIVNRAIAQVCRAAEKNRLGKKLSNINQNGIDYCKHVGTYNSFVAIWELMAINTILVAG